MRIRQEADGAIERAAAHLLDELADQFALTCSLIRGNVAAGRRAAR